ncbi:unnamed protein product [Gulo gulo]|uniref:Uncharacterized protein n=1 Tax=Gulo gulo TaxID=48420 RepID=A0A9X9PTE9_GULGU|nr:unnamed protein product [Gulo gulo]
MCSRSFAQDSPEWGRWSQHVCHVSCSFMIEHAVECAYAGGHLTGASGPESTMTSICAR